jgi:hypothetical protein
MSTDRTAFADRPTVGGHAVDEVVSTYTAAGPTGVARPLWLATPAAEHWVPSNDECVTRYMDWRGEVSMAGAGQRPQPARV